MEMNHKKDWCGARLMDSTYEAINCFLIINAIRDIRDLDTNTHRSMLLNMSRFKAVQERISKIVEDYLKDVIRIVKQCSKLGAEALENETVSSLKKTFDNQFADILGRNGTLITWNEVFSKLYDSIKDIQVATINSNKFSPKLDYKANEKRGIRVIAVGGIALSRGLTLEGLCVSYLYRNTATYDVLMQMGRWFGYRTGYEDLIRIYLTDNTEKYYKEISDAIESLKTDIVKKRLLMLSIFTNNNSELENKIEDYLNKNDLEQVRIKMTPLSSILKLDYSNSKYFNEAKLSQPNPTPSRNTIWDNNLKIIDENGNIADHSATITTKQDRHPNSGNLYFDYPKNKLSKYRFLTPRECFLLMGFDENDYEKIIKNNLASRKGSLFFSRDKMYKLAGNSIVVNVLEQIFDTIVSLDELFFSNKK